ncbi:MAG TPA: hypothetical protein VHD83_12980 [Puia sp.]|nr:hypothetical protein [Puia sp.]
MHRCRAILIAFLATLAATFTIELPFTQVNYIHQLASKKERRITSTPKDTHRLHKTYYESPADMLPMTFVRVVAPYITPLARPVDLSPCHPLTGSAGHPNVLRGPPAFA